jgi:hypothetical protein
VTSFAAPNVSAAGTANSIEARMRNEVESADEYLNRMSRGLCGCGCETVVKGRQIYVGASHKQRACRVRIRIETRQARIRTLPLDRPAP